MYFNVPPAEQPQSPRQSTSWENARTCAAGLKAAGADEGEILQKLQEMGLTYETAGEVLSEFSTSGGKKDRRRRAKREKGERKASDIDRLIQAQVQAEQDAGRTNMQVGGAVFLIGLVVTLGSIAMVNNGGGSVVIAFGAIIWGAAQFIRGLAQASTPSR